LYNDLRIDLKLPICSFDAKTGVLCPKCESKLRSGHLSKTDVDTSVKLTKLVGRYPELNKITMVRAINVRGDYVLVLGHGDLKVFHRDFNLKKLESEFGVKVWAIEGGSTDRKILEDLFFPIRIVTVNIVWLPDGSKLTKVIIPGRKTERFPIDIEKLKEVIKEVRGIDLMVEFGR
jgi:transcription antitermination factor NusA-like protein